MFKVTSAAAVQVRQAEQQSGAEGLAPIPDGQEEAVIESAEECPGECIFIEVE